MSLISDPVLFAIFIGLAILFLYSCSSFIHPPLKVVEPPRADAPEVNPMPPPRPLKIGRVSRGWYKPHIHRRRGGEYHAYVLMAHRHVITSVGSATPVQAMNRLFAENPGLVFALEFGPPQQFRLEH